MATLIPSLNAVISRMQSGEKRFARRLQSHLCENTLCWFDIPVGRRQRFSDFIVLNPNRGLLLIEVKDWKIDTINEINKKTVSIRTKKGLSTVANPLEQVRQCAYQMVQQLEKDPNLLQQNGRYQGGLICPYGFGVALANITRKQFEDNQLNKVLAGDQVICKDEIAESVSHENFQSQLNKMFTVNFDHVLSQCDVDRIRSCLFPEIRIGQYQQEELFPSPLDDQEVNRLIPDIVPVMDMTQELLARSLGDGHRVIHGVAGSGKTLILVYRAIHLAKELDRPIAVLCFNITLAARIREMISHGGVSDKVDVFHFHDWCGELLRRHDIPKPESGKGYRYITELVETTIDAVERELIPKGQYGSVMIDEGHDFEPGWLQLASDMVDPNTNSLLLLYDDAQAIYSSKRPLAFSLSSVGVQARGRTSILKINYRNTEPIMALANRLEPLGTEKGSENRGDDESADTKIRPVSAGRPGANPVVRTFSEFDEEVRYIAMVFQKMHEERNLDWSDMCVVYPVREIGKEIMGALDARKIPTILLNSSSQKKKFKQSEPCVKAMTIHSSKGLEFPLVAVAGLGIFDKKKSNHLDPVKLAYVAMTRATEYLLMTGHKDSQIVSQLMQCAEAA